MGIGQSQARRYDQEGDARVTFDDVAGIDEAENELVEIVDFLKDPSKYTRLGGTAPKGVLLVGAPGTGKTLLAKAVAGEAGVPFFSMSAAEFMEMIVGVGAARVRDLFKQAREHAPAIIFIDELDAIGRARGQFALGGSSEQEQTLNQILTEMDGFSSREGVIVLAATNQPDVLDKALLRPGRFDRRVVVNLPDKTGREAILKVHTRSVPLAADVDARGARGGDAGLLGRGSEEPRQRSGAARGAARAGRRCAEGLLRRAREDRAGPGAADPAEPRGPRAHRLSRGRPRDPRAGRAGRRPGASRHDRAARPGARRDVPAAADADRYNYPEAYLRARIVGMLGGRAAEEIVYGTRTTGAESDIEQATELARNMVTRWGMSEKLGLVQLAPRANPYLGGAPAFGADRPFSEATAQVIDAEVQRIIDESYDEAHAAAARAPQGARRAGRGAARARDARRGGDPGRHRPAAGGGAAGAPRRRARGRRDRRAPARGSATPRATR